MKSLTKIRCRCRRELADTITPVSAYLRLRDIYPGALLLESTDSRAAVNSFSFICANPAATFTFDGSPDGSTSSLVERLQAFVNSFTLEHEGDSHLVRNGVFGITSYDAVQYFEDIKFREKKHGGPKVPLISYSLYEYIVAVNHFQNEMFLLHNCVDGSSAESSMSKLEALLTLIRNRDYAVHPFERSGSEFSEMADEEHLDVINQSKKHIARGDIFQIVPSRRFSQSFRGDDFNVYRALRSINPSPYLFYFDYGNFRVFGSSPEAQLVVEKGKASIFPIAGTYRRTGDEQSDAATAEKLMADPKESAEHVMLVDLARNDLSRHCDTVEVERFKEAHFYSHVIHLVSKVSGNLRPGTSTVQIVGDTFPAGTLSGAPKYMAMELIDRFEPSHRGLYGGCIGFYDFEGGCNQAIIIRSFVSHNHTLYYQAGGGVVADSQPETEVQEVRNKLAALRRALELAERIRP